ncbi:hypothetical protein [Streptococcus oricebi]|uniref:Response regulator n=1 Tax=Streptococcus oricebi TaxID=1547447 RepID=A0ABS5B3I3_9STRE|nr:hypothetical protein [Streptococcus oricebi]MBP2623013.1 hypothetical protein [Streptococcus oricebi]
MNVRKIYFIDDEDEARYAASYTKLRKKFEDAQYCVEFFSIINKESEEIFLKELASNKICGIILDFDLKQSNIYADANALWKKIKSHNSLFPMCIYTSHKQDVSQLKGCEKIFSKGNESEIEEMLKYMKEQIELGLAIIKQRTDVNNILKSDQTFSVEVLENERRIEDQFSIVASRELPDEVSKELNELIKKAYEIIDNYSEG